MHAGRRWLRVFAVLGPPLATAALFALTGPGASAGAADDEPESDVRTLYLRDCAICHGAAGQGTADGPTLLGVGAASAHYMLTTGRMPISDPDEELERSDPSYPPDVIDELVDLVANLAPGGMPVPEVDVEGANVAEGGELYRLNCAACHQAIGSGGALVDREAPSLRESTAVQTVEAIRIGPGQMPAYGRAALSEEQVASVAAYVTEVISDPDDRGGLPIWHLGPVPEGAVAIVVGLGTLVLVAAWIERPDRRAES